MQRTHDAHDRFYTVGELAGELAVTARALRFYEDKGLLAPRRAGQNRVYTHRDRARMILILRGKRLGFSLREIREWLDLYEADRDHVRQTRLLAQKIEARIAMLEQQRRDIEATLGELVEVRRQVEDHLKGAALNGQPPGKRET
ncbi:MAG: MerR family DNA-binding transcriptional regulator [Geminicoccaceae bacterium]|nr:MerR family DNA-binding transcriptional regulator [Geminicoccaceae bacterium]